MQRLLTIASFFALVGLPSLADEVWTSPTGDIVYESEMAGDAIWSFYHPADGSGATLIIPGLAGNYDERSTHEAYWIGNSPGLCLSTMTHPSGVSGNTWGRAIVSFDEPAFPTSLSIAMGDCFGPIYAFIRGSSTAE